MLAVYATCFLCKAVFHFYLLADPAGDLHRAGQPALQSTLRASPRRPISLAISGIFDSRLNKRAAPFNASHTRNIRDRQTIKIKANISYNLSKQKLPTARP